MLERRAGPRASAETSKRMMSETTTCQLNVYECMFLLDTNKVAGDVPAAAKQLHGILEKNQAEVLASRPVG